VFCAINWRPVAPTSRNPHPPAVLAISLLWFSQTPGNSQLTGRPNVVSVDGRLTGNLANNVSDAFRPHLGAMLAITWYFAVIARVERYRSTISGHRDLAAQHHDAHVEIAVRMEIFGQIRFLTAINHLEPFAPQIALESLSRERAAIAAATGDIGDALGANLFGMQAAGGDFTALPGTECFRVVVARYGDLAAKNEQSGVEVMTVVGFSRVRSQAGVDDAKAVAPEVSLEFKTIHRCSPLLMRFAGSKIGQRKCLT
jgi:hypothetical protein